MATMIQAPLRRVRCRRCGVRVEQVPWAALHSRLTYGFEQEVLNRARETSIQGVCRQLRVHWETVMTLVGRWVKRAAKQRFRRSLRRIGVDEFSYGSGQQKYLTVVWDHDRGEVVWIGEGREGKTLEEFFSELGPRRAQALRCVTMDMAHGYIAAVKKCAPNADIVFDRFHIEQHLSIAVNEIRKEEFWRRGGKYRKAIKGKKYLLLKRRRRLHWRRRRELDRLLALNRRLNAAYALKEQFELIWEQRTEMEMLIGLVAWRLLLRWQRLRPLERFWETLSRHKEGVIAWAKHQLTNGALESHNSRARAMSQRARGYRNPHNFMLMLYQASWS
jgi:transposase